MMSNEDFIYEQTKIYEEIDRRRRIAATIICTTIVLSLVCGICYYFGVY
jgi:hypothetical protein